MTTRGKLVFTLLILGVVGFGVFRWWDKIAPTGRSQNPSIDAQALKDSLAKQAAVTPPATDVIEKT